MLSKVRKTRKITLSLGREKNINCSLKTKPQCSAEFLVVSKNRLLTMKTLKKVFYGIRLKKSMRVRELDEFIYFPFIIKLHTILFGHYRDIRNCYEAPNINNIVECEDMLFFQTIDIQLENQQKVK